MRLMHHVCSWYIIPNTQTTKFTWNKLGPSQEGWQESRNEWRFTVKTPKLKEFCKDTIFTIYGWQISARSLWRKPIKAKEHNTIVFAFLHLPTLGQIRPLYSQFTEPSSTTPAWVDARLRVNEELLSAFDVEHHGCSVPRLRHLQTSNQVCVTHRLQTSRNRSSRSSHHMFLLWPIAANHPVPLSGSSHK